MVASHRTLPLLSLPNDLFACCLPQPWAITVTAHSPNFLWQRLPQSLRYLLVGGANTVVGYAIFAMTYWGLRGRMPHEVILAVSHVLAVSFSFSTHQRWVFADTQRPGRLNKLCAWWRFQLAYLGLLFLGLGVNAILLQWVTSSIWWAQAGAVVTGIFIGYALQHRFVFRKNLSQESHCS